MAVVNFYSSFEYKWGQTGGVIDFQDDQYKIGWAFIGSTPPSVEQFNKLQQLNDEKFAWLWGQFKAAADARKVPLTANDLLGLDKILAAATPDATTSVKGLTAYATDAEAQALTSKTKALTPYGLGLSLKDATTAVKGLTAYATDAEATALTSKTKALTPYGLGLNVQASPNDTGAGKLLAVGRSFGIGSSSALASYDLWPSASLNDANVPSGPYYTNSTISDRPNNAGGIIWHRQAGSLVSQIYELGGVGGLLHRNGLTAAWKEVLNVGDYGVGGGTATPPNGRDGVNPMGWYYRNTPRPSFGGGSFFLELPYNSIVGGFRLSNDPYTDAYYLNSWNRDTGTYNPAVRLLHSGIFDPDTKADKSSTISVQSTTPTTNVGEVIYVVDRQQILYWQKIGTFTGYASPDVGRFVWGTSANARPGEINAIGGTVDGAHRAFAPLIAWAESNGHVVPLAQWTPGTFKFALVSGNTWRVPDLRNQFIRATGTDADTANARSLGSTQVGMQQSHDHGLQTEAGSGLGKLVFADHGHARAPWVEVAPANWNDQAANGFRVATAESGGSETRPTNVALHPRIQI